MNYDDLYYYAYGGGNSTISFFSLAISVLAIVAMWKIFTKAGESGWAAIIPFYNMYVLFKISWGNGWYFLLLLIPLANIVILIITMVKLAKAFGKGGGFACGLIFLYIIFLCILAFNNDIEYAGVNGVAAAPPPGGYGNGGYGGGGYQNPYQSPQEPSFRQYQQDSPQNPEYRYQRNEPQGSPGGFCPNCGAKLDPGTKFCGGCGKQL